MVANAKHIVLGTAGEDAAIQYLEGLGWRIRARNWRPAGALHGLELDIVGDDSGTLVFVEVKTRNQRHPAGQALAADRSGDIPVLAAFSPAKRRRFLKAARYFLAAHGLWDMPCRFDLVCVKHTPQGEFLLEHHDNVIEFGDLVDSGDAPWQPW